MQRMIGIIILFSMFSFSVKLETGSTQTIEEFAKDSYNNIGNHDLYYKPYKIALQGYYQLLAKGKLRNPDYITIIDFTRSSNSERLFVIDTKTWKVIHTSLVAHGMETGEEYALDFSNEEGSHQSSIGFFLTGEIYNGKHDKSLKLDGQEKYNSEARNRGVVIHAADYVSFDYIKENGRLGRSYGCPALPATGYDNMVEKIKNGSCLFIYYPKKYYLQNSHFLKTKTDFKLDCEGKLE